MSKSLLLTTLALCFGLASQAQADCSTSLTAQYQQIDSIVQALRVDKPGQMRAYAADGSEYTGGQVLWLHGRMRRVARLCAADTRQERKASLIIGEVSEFVQSRRRRS